jgi:secondary thiamine-phosphate synthase enzyme
MAKTGLAILYDACEDRSTVREALTLHHMRAWPENDGSLTNPCENPSPGALVRNTTRRAFLNITPQVEAAVRASGVQDGLCLVNAMHTSASGFINDDESGLHADHERWLEKLAPEKPPGTYEHNLTGEDNADAHLKRQIMGREVVVAITGGRLDFGPWEQIFYGEFDGRRRKRVLVKIIGA